MFDYRLKVFHTVASRLSFTKASEELHISQPAVTKHIKEIETQLGAKLFDRKGTSIQLTQSGKILHEYAEKIRNIYRDLEFQISQVNQQHKGKLIIGASTTVAQYILPEILAKFNTYYKDIKIELLTGNTEAISALLKEEKIDLGIIEGESQSAYFDYKTFKADEIVLAAKASHPLAHKTLQTKDLYDIDMIFREQGSGTLEFIQNRLREKGINISELKTVIQLGSSESIKNYLLYSDCMAFLSISTILTELKNNILTVVDIKNFSIERNFHFILPKGDQSELIALFLKFAE
ncbi:LysR family transcriptional regulator [Chryseobacterium indologenes]|uniref:LysR family transcriptional regulator n=1 Tax=Chryseobacterium indologenes TaxID=253 RepID=UPI000B5175BE|nr:LysR family transcriptional regulator [Chryseobacterium indologenes]ASE60437.1 LysR family transcriptional regulator [Chryseobacterium indologenes]ATN04622.1 LysR family transcriptional regulator [Chryseobacterium indologenes]AYY86626.1 LysR family transcriptional regulator [Chryseobacterium indologenes]QIX83527.1 LysR family transcriptional regulator [Chryseobacterium indologenes]UDQ53227.1 LysR family transcriptional regulator [Chryseobacterium indologenes]